MRVYTINAIDCPGHAKVQFICLRWAGVCSNRNCQEIKVPTLFLKQIEEGNWPDFIPIKSQNDMIGVRMKKEDGCVARTFAVSKFEGVEV